MEDLTDAIAIEQARTSFIATISHELRTPLMVLSGNADLLLRGCTGALTVEQQILIESIRTHTQRMAGLVNNVIILAELEAGMLPADPRPLRLSQSLDEILWSIRRLLTLRGIALQIDLPPDLPLIVADRQHLAIILQQLLDNAQRYTIQGHITIRAVEETDTIRIDLSDTGCGIAPETAATLFTRFNRNQERLNTTQRGFGLGLAIARELTEHQGGQIWLAETSACGTTFSLRLPCVVTLPTDTAPLSYAAAA
jgi:signal transduction histidine kinase